MGQGELCYSQTTPNLPWGCSAEAVGQVFPFTGHVEVKLSDSEDCTTSNNNCFCLCCG